MRLASCPRCGKPRPKFDAIASFRVQRCGQVTQLTRASAFWKRRTPCGRRAEVTLRTRKRVLSLIEQHDEYLKARGDDDIITATLDENWTGEEHVDEPDAE